MTISYPRDFPHVPIQRSRFGLNINQSVFQSTLSRKTNVQDHAAGKTDRWQGVFTTARLTTAQQAELSAWLVSMRGLEGSFNAFDPDQRMPLGVVASGSSTPKIMGASQSGRSLSTDGWAMNTTGLLLPGDYFQIGSQFYMVLERVDSDAGGLATVSFEPTLRSSPADNTNIIFEDPILVARVLANPAQWETDQLRSGNISFAWEEVI